MKYQFCIRFEKTTEHTAATKAVLDCNTIFLEQGYRDYTLTVWDNSDKLRYYTLLLKELFIFYKAIGKGSVIGIQYPLLSINNIFKVFIKLARAKGVKFFCIIHDLESLRTGGTKKKGIKQEIGNLNAFDFVIAHNQFMISWLQQNGLTAPVSEIGLFDYLAPTGSKKEIIQINRTIAFAGNLEKSIFVYQLSNIGGWNFNVYGPGFAGTGIGMGEPQWLGSYPPELIAEKLKGDFGLIWDGEEIDRCGGMMGNYLRYNNPHKFSLYMAAGLPVIAPVNSAIGDFIKANRLGFLVSSLHDLEHIIVTEESYIGMKKNVSAFQDKVKQGYFFSAAIHHAEQQLTEYSI